MVVKNVLTSGCFSFDLELKMLYHYKEISPTFWDAGPSSLGKIWEIP